MSHSQIESNKVLVKCKQEQGSFHPREKVIKKIKEKNPCTLKNLWKEILSLPTISSSTVAAALPDLPCTVIVQFIANLIQHHPKAYLNLLLLC